MPLVPETKMADTSKQSVSGTHWPREPHSQCSKLRPPLHLRPAFLEPPPWQEFSINTLIFHTHTLSLFFTFPLTGPTRSPQCDFQREHYHSLTSTISGIPPQKCTCSASILLLFGEIFFNFKNNRNFVKPPKERKKQHGRRHVLPNIQY